MYMFKYICKRIGLMIMTFLIIFVTCFVLVKLLPVDTSTVGIGEDADKIRIELEARGYNKPILEQFGLYLKRIILFILKVKKFSVKTVLNGENIFFHKDKSFLLVKSVMERYVNVPIQKI